MSQTTGLSAKCCQCNRKFTITSSNKMEQFNDDVIFVKNYLQDEDGLDEIVQEVGGGGRIFKRLFGDKGYFLHINGNKWQFICVKCYKIAFDILKNNNSELTVGSVLTGTKHMNLNKKKKSRVNPFKPNGSYNQKEHVNV